MVVRGPNPDAVDIGCICTTRPLDVAHVDNPQSSAQLDYRLSTVGSYSIACPNLIRPHAENVL